MWQTLPRLLKMSFRFDPLAEKIYPLGLKRKNPLEAENPLRSASGKNLSARAEAEKSA
jgi:hypothetical protein